MELAVRLRAARAAAALAAAIAVGILPLAAPVARGANTDYIANCSTNLRTSASTSGTVAAVIATGAIVTASGSVTGEAWSATCGGVDVAGSTWYAIVAVGGQSASSLYGVSPVYAATGLFRLAPPPGNYLEGIDVSHWQGSIDWTKVATSNKKFAIMKVTESTMYADAEYPGWHTQARAVGIRVGGYHYAQPSTTSNDAVLEADWFVSHLNLTAGDLNPALDLEESNGLSVSALQTWVGAWLNRVYTATGIRPMIYTSPSFWSTYMGGTRQFADAGYDVLWVAHWFVGSPTVPASNWGGKGWTFWQYSNCGSVPGISGCVDLDRYNGLDMTKVTYDPSFSVAVTPASQSVKQGVGTSFGVAITRKFFTLPIDLSVTGVPAGATATFDAAQVTGSATTLRVTTSKSGTITPVGSHPLTITATSGGFTLSTAVTLIVSDGIQPVVTGPTSGLYAVTKMSTTARVRSAWSATDLSGIGSYEVLWQVNGGNWSNKSLPSPTTTSTIDSLTFGSLYRFATRATDKAGNVSFLSYGTPFRPYLTQESAGVSYTGSWSSTSNVNASGGALRYATGAGASASYTFVGSSISWVSYRGPNRGSAKVYIDGVLVSTVNLYQAAYDSKQVVFARNWTANGSHTIKVVCVGTAGHARIDIDAFVRLVLS